MSSVKRAAHETVYAVLENPMIPDHRGIRMPGPPRNAANDDLASKIVEALEKSNLLRESYGDFPSGPVRSEPKRS
jgi:hypothetical protein